MRLTQFYGFLNMYQFLFGTLEWKISIPYLKRMLRAIMRNSIRSFDLTRSRSRAHGLYNRIWRFVYTILMRFIFYHVNRVHVSRTICVL